jgi:hypothetical protein
MKNACGGCDHFVSAPGDLEREVAGLKILSSAYGSVRADTGLCRVHDSFCTPDHTCPQWRSDPPTR